MKFLKVFCLLFVCYSAVLAAAVDDNTLLPVVSTLADRQQKIQFAFAKNRDAFITKTVNIHSPTVLVPTLELIPPAAAPGRLIPQSYFNTSDIKIVDYYVRRVIHYALQAPAAGQGNPQNVTVTQRSQNNIIIKCNLRASGDLLPYFQQGETDGIGRNMIPDINHPMDAHHRNGWLTDWIQVAVQKKLNGWEISTAYPVDYN